MGWSNYTVADDTMAMESTRANTSTVSSARGRRAGPSNTISVRMHDDLQKKRVSECTLMLWGVIDLVAVGLMVWAVVATGLFSVDTARGTIEVGIFEQCTAVAGTAEQVCVRTDIFSRIPYWQWAGGILAIAVLLSLIGIIVIMAASCNGGGWVRSARLCAAARNFLLLAAWILVPIGFGGLGEECDSGDTIHCGLTYTAAPMDGYFGSFEVPSNWNTGIGTYALFTSVLLHYVASGVAGWVLLRKGQGLSPQAGGSGGRNQYQVSANGSYMSRMTTQGLQTSFDGPSAGLYRSMAMQNNSAFESGGFDAAYPTTTLTQSQRC